MELEKHISKLLLTNDCVIVPGFGGFMTHHVEAVYDASISTFYPPTRTLGFSSQLKMNDSLIVQSFVEEYYMSYPEAFTQVENDVAELRQIIETNGEYEMHGLGTFSVSDNGVFDFVPCEAGILTPNFYGLDSIELVSIEKRHAPAESVKPQAAVVAAPSLQGSESAATEVSPATTDQPLDEEEPTATTARFRSIVTKLAVACVAFFVMLMIPSHMSETPKQSALQSGIDTNLLTRILPKTVVKQSPDLKAIASQTAKVQQAQADSLRQAALRDSAASEKPYFSIVLASRVTKKNAEAFVQTLHKEGYTDASVLARGKSVKVVYGKFDTERQARQARNKLTDNIEFSDSWILEVK